MSQPSDGAAGDDLRREVHAWWTEAATAAGIDLTDFDPEDPLAERLAWARGRGLEIAGILARQSTKKQHSIGSQVQENARHAGLHGMYPAPEFVCVDNAVTGRKERRAGLDRMRALLGSKSVQVLLVFKVSRLFRSAYKGFAFFQEEIVEEGLRAVSISQGIDTRNQATWSTLAAVHGMADQMLLQAIADHVHSGIASLFQAGFVTGALPVGYRPREVPGAPSTNLGRPRTVPEIDPEVAERIRLHFKSIRQGMPIRQGWRRWVADGGPCDPRASTGYMTYPAYRRMLANPRYTGRWAFGRRRNVWSSKRDYVRQVDRPDAEVKIIVTDDLRIVDDETFFAVQARLDEMRHGPRRSKSSKPVQLWDLVTDLFHCAHCRVRFYQSGSHGRGMSCKQDKLCPARSTIRRDEAVGAICRELGRRIREDSNLVDAVIGRSQSIDAEGDATTRVELARVERAIAGHTQKVDDLIDLAGQGTAEDRADLKARVRKAQAERTLLQAEQARLRRLLHADRPPITPGSVRIQLEDFQALLEEGAAGKLGADQVHRAAETFRGLVGGRIWVHVEARPGRKRTTARGVFHPDLLRTTRRALDHDPATPASAEEVPAAEVWLRPPPKKDRLAGRVHQLIDIDGISYRQAAAAMQAEGHPINSGVVWQVYQRYYEMLGQPVPDRPYNNGRPRAAR